MRRRVRVISYAWGDKYVDDFLGLTLAALLADGNVPELVRRFDVDFVLLTEEHQFERVRAAPTWRRLETLCAAKLVSLDDLVVGHWYGISLSKALVRGFADLGETVLDTWLVFLNADFIVADGSYRTVADRIEADERLIFAPSYCVVRESALPALREHLSGEVLSIPPRRMASIGLPNRHYTVRAKTVNQRLFRIHRYDQFYWYVDETTLLGRQMPIALVAMRPEKILTDIQTFWDYGIVSEAAPTARQFILGDSDAYQMLELRDERTFEHLIGLGWPTVDEITRDLSSFTTKDQRDHLPHELVWHSGDLPPTLPEARTRFQQFIDDVAARLSPEPVSHLGHTFWTSAIGRFEELRAHHLAHRAGTPRIDRPAPAGLIAETMPSTRAAALGSRFFGGVPFVKRPHPYWADLRHAARAIAEATPLDRANVLLVSSGPGLFERVALVAAAHRKLSPGYLLGDAEQRLNVAGDLCVTLEDRGGVRREVLARRVIVRQRGGNETLPALAPEERFDLCLCELGWDDLKRFREIFQEIRPHIRHGGRIVVLHVDSSLRRRWHEEREIIRTCFPLEGRSEVFFSGTAGSRFARRILARAEKVTGPARRVALAAGAGLASLGSWLASPGVERQDPYKASPYATSLTMIIDLP